MGAAVTYREALESSLVAERSPLLIEVIGDIGDVQVRNRGTLGGSVAHADPSLGHPGGDAGARRLVRPPVRDEPARGARPRRSSRARSRRTSRPGSCWWGCASRSCPTVSARRIGRSCSPRRATPWSVWRRSWRSSEGQVNHVRVGITGVADIAYPRHGRRGGPAGHRRRGGRAGRGCRPRGRRPAGQRRHPRRRRVPDGDGRGHHPASAGGGDRPGQPGTKGALGGSGRLWRQPTSPWRLVRTSPGVREGAPHGRGTAAPGRTMPCRARAVPGAGSPAAGARRHRAAGSAPLPRG